ncbi:putative transcriptional regulator [Quadrisphaera granulorum]|uniref:Putative transcriptional regulator n=1 Tax=Quadrisphaera granulorum TaxID=317664 RepID=A0A315ZPL8_9ACTN|nr:helix-turn-helix transcriptional regulator [Quadrisphaera granulorum]PWJ47466.1 putative transcriptional regulator [Quadrisphaera granulorum]SZE98767.1 putative transcriptional regulator [Quadrisphaera granulorum]
MSSDVPDTSGDQDDDGGPGVVVRLDELLAERGMTMTELSRRTGITMANLSVLKNNKARAIRMTTIAALCRALDVDPGQLLTLDRQR